MASAPAGDRQHVGRVVLFSCILVTPVAIAIDLWLNSASAESAIRAAVYLSIAAISTYLLKRHSQVRFLPIYLGLVFGALSLFDAVTSSEVSLTTPGT
ncbi:MAG: hypothetical protein WEB67_05360, partial [Acidimicrobiia bacterium]